MLLNMPVIGNLETQEKCKEKIKITTILLPIDNYGGEFLMFSDFFLCLCVTHADTHTPSQFFKSNLSSLLTLLSLIPLVYLCHIAESPPVYITKLEPLNHESFDFPFVALELVPFPMPHAY